MKLKLIEFYKEYRDTFEDYKIMAQWYSITQTECKRLVQIGKKYSDRKDKLINNLIKK